ncbi:hypothetical protein RhiJN_03536 [Ceratobasidium sp. AG-Ba]|nr:hypothetical protein RhiJN_03536 [Ceratobasidium sp. AG-Ba]
MFDLAMPLAWKYVDDIQRLFALLPVPKQVQQVDEAPKKPSSSSLEDDFERFNVYAPWVRHLEFWTCLYYPKHRELDRIRHYSMEHTVLPNLRYISVTTELGFVKMSVIMPFISPSLVGFRLGPISYEPIPELSESEFSLLLTALCDKRCRMKYLSVPASRSLGVASSGTADPDDSRGGQKNRAGRLFKDILPTMGPLAGLTISSNILEHDGLRMIGSWRALERFEIVGASNGQNDDFAFPQLDESAFPFLEHLGLYRLSGATIFDIVQNVPSLVGGLTSIKILPLSSDYLSEDVSPPIGLKLLPILVKRCPRLQSLWLRVCDAKYLVHRTPVSALDALMDLPLQSLFLEGIHLVECTNVPKHLAKIFPALVHLGLPDHRLSFVDLRTVRDQMPQLGSLSIGLDAGSLSDVKINYEDPGRHPQYPLRVLEARFRKQGLHEERCPDTPRSYTFQQVSLFVRYLSSLWPDVQLLEQQVTAAETNSEIPGCMTKFFNDQLAMLSRHSCDSVLKCDDTAVLDEENWKLCEQKHRIKQ